MRLHVHACIPVPRQVTCGADCSDCGTVAALGQAPWGVPSRAPTPHRDPRGASHWPETGTRACPCSASMLDGSLTVILRPTLERYVFLSTEEEHSNATHGPFRYLASSCVLRNSSVWCFPAHSAICLSTGLLQTSEASMDYSANPDDVAAVGTGWRCRCRCRCRCRMPASQATFLSRFRSDAPTCVRHEQDMSMEEVSMLTRPEGRGVFSLTSHITARRRKTAQVQDLFTARHVS